MDDRRPLELLSPWHVQPAVADACGEQNGAVGRRTATPESPTARPPGSRSAPERKRRPRGRSSDRGSGCEPGVTETTRVRRIARADEPQACAEADEQPAAEQVGPKGDVSNSGSSPTSSRRRPTGTTRTSPASL